MGFVGRRAVHASLAVIVAAAAALLAVPASAAPGYAPVDQPGPPLQVEAAEVLENLDCTEDVAEGEPALLMVPPTSLDPDEAYHDNLYRLVADLEMPYCAVTVPQHTNGDIQIAAEYVVFAIRHLHELTGEQVPVFGWSQGGGPLPRWALRWWPDTRHQVSELVALAPPNRGTPTVNALCTPDCVPALWQQRSGAEFLDALNSGRLTFPGIDYTVIYSETDGVVIPPAETSPLPEGRAVSNIAVQDVCRADASSHIGLLYSPAAVAAVADALTHDGPADIDRVREEADCLALTSPYSTPAESATGQQVKLAVALARFANGRVPSEPPLECYVTVSCDKRT